MSDYTRDIRVAFQGHDGMARWRRILWDEEIKVLYFEDHAGSIVEVWLNGSTRTDDHEDFGVWSNNSLNNNDAVVLWEEPEPEPIGIDAKLSKTCKFDNCACDLPKEGNEPS